MKKLEKGQKFYITNTDEPDIRLGQIYTVISSKFKGKSQIVTVAERKKPITLKNIKQKLTENI